jgi:hypothetical protein
MGVNGKCLTIEGKDRYQGAATPQVCWGYWYGLVGLLHDRQPVLLGCCVELVGNTLYQRQGSKSAFWAPFQTPDT